MPQLPTTGDADTGIVGTAVKQGQRSPTTVYERENQVLAYGWESLTQGDIQRINGITKGVLAKKRTCPLPETEAAFAIAACLYTGRRLAELAALPIRIVPHWHQDLGKPERHAGLYKVSEHWGWLLPAGRPAEQAYQNDKAAEQSINRSDNLWLPTTLGVIALVEMSLRQREAGSTGAHLPMFQTPVSILRETMLALLRSDQSVRRAGTTVEAVERWLTGAVRFNSGGDPAVAKVMTDRSDLRSKTTSYYTSVTQPQIEAAWTATVSPVTPVTVRRAPSLALTAQSYGSQYCPKETELALLRTKLVKAINEANDPVKLLRAQTLYTVVLLTLGIALRPTQYPALARRCFDRGSGFGVVDDKRQSDGFTVRLAWFPPVLRSQLAIHEGLVAKLAPTIASMDATSSNVASREGYSFFTYDKQSQLCRTNVSNVVNTLRSRHECHFVPNFARHFLRSRLVGHCSSETLHAFMGHSLSGTEPWGKESGFDPLLYREELMQTLVPLLADRGWTAVASPA